MHLLYSKHAWENPLRLKSNSSLVKVVAFAYNYDVEDFTVSDIRVPLW